MNIAKNLVVLTLIPLVSSLDPLTYWVHRSCSDKEHFFPRGMASAKQMAESALSMLHSEDDDYGFYIFWLIFRAPLQQNNAAGDAVSDRLIDIFTAFAEMEQKFSPELTEEPTGNYRYYCDDDKLHGQSRWQLRPDPPPDQQPSGYIPQADRPIFSFFWNPEGGPWQEYWDPANNGILMGPTRGCGDSSDNMMVPWDPTPIRASAPGYPRAMIWVTATICDSLLFSEEPFVGRPIDEAIEGRDFGELVGAITDSLAKSSSAFLLHEFCRYPPWKLQDLYVDDDVSEDIWRSGPGPPSEPDLVLRWRSLLREHSIWDRVRDPWNIVFYAILARMKDYDWCIEGTDRGEVADEFFYRCSSRQPEHFDFHLMDSWIAAEGAESADGRASTMEEEGENMSVDQLFGSSGGGSQS